MTLGFGELPVRIRRVVYYTLTAWEQRYWATFLSQQVPSFLRGTKEAFVTIGPVAAIMIATMKWSKKANKEYKRKNPKLYENDK